MVMDVGYYTQMTVHLELVKIKAEISAFFNEKT